MIHNLSYRAFVYGTENEEKVREAIHNMMPMAHPEMEITKGYYKNQVLILHGKTSKNSEIKVLLEKLQNLSPNDKKKILKELHDRMDSRGNLFLRFDKQHAYLGDLKLVEHGDALHLKLKIAAYPAKKGEAIKVARKIFGD
jgi:RNA binding exosome subunit